MSPLSRRCRITDPTRPVSDVITLHLVHLMHPVAELRGCLAETAHSIFHIALLLTNRYAPLARHSYSSPGREGRYRTIDKLRKIQLLDPQRNSIIMFVLGEPERCARVQKLSIEKRKREVHKYSKSYACGKININKLSG